MIIIIIIIIIIISFTDRSPPGMARSNLNLRGASLRWTHQQPSKVVTVSQIAAPRDGEV